MKKLGYEVQFFIRVVRKWCALMKISNDFRHGEGFESLRAYHSKRIKIIYRKGVLGFSKILFYFPIKTPKFDAVQISCLKQQRRRDRGGIPLNLNGYIRFQIIVSIPGRYDIKL